MIPVKIILCPWFHASRLAWILRVGMLGLRQDAVPTLLMPYSLSALLRRLIHTFYSSQPIVERTVRTRLESVCFVQTPCSTAQPAIP